MLKAFLNGLKNALLGGIEDALAAQVNQEFDALVDALVAAAKEKIPGAIDDIVLETLKAQYKQILKEKALVLIDKIDGQVG